MEEVHTEDPSKGYRQIRDVLDWYHKVTVNDKRILRICRALDIKSTIKYDNHGCTRNAKNPQYIAENVLNRVFSAEKPNEKWLTDVTEFKWYEGVQVYKLYLSAILDLYDRRRCKVHFMRNILAHVPQKSKQTFAAHLKEIWLAPDIETAKKRADDLCAQYEKSFPKAIETMEEGLEDSLTFYHFKSLDHRKISSSNMIERLNWEIRRRTKVVGISPNETAYCRFVTAYLMDYAEEWSMGRCYMKQEALERAWPPS